MQREEFYYDSRDGVSKIHAIRWTPDPGTEPIAILQVIHGMQEYVGRYEDFAQYMTDRGFVVMGEDHLGHGLSIGEDGTAGYFCEVDPATVVVRDVHRLKKLTQEMYPGLPIYILGHSMGSFILRNYMYRYGTGIQGAIVMGTGQPPKAAVSAGALMAATQSKIMGPKSIGKKLAAMSFAGYFKRIPDKKTDLDWLSVNEENVQKYIADPLCGQPFTANGYVTLFELVRRMEEQENVDKVPKKLHVLFVAGGDDPVGSYGEGVNEAAGELKKAQVEDVTVKLYPGDRHEILNEDDKETVKSDIYEWVKARIEADAAK